MNRQELLAAWVRHLDGEALSAAESTGLRTALDGDESLRETLLADLALDGLLRNRLDDEDAGRSFVAGVATVLRAQAEPPDFAVRIRQRIVHSQRLRLRRARRRTGGRMAALAAGLLLLVGGVWLGLQRQGSPADLPRLAGAPQQMTVGSELSASRDSVLEWADGTRAEVLAGSRLTVLAEEHGKRLHLIRGRIAVQANPQPAGRPMAIRTPEALATVVGTGFVLDSAAGTTRLTVDHGAVRLGGGGPEVLVAAGGRAVADREGVRAAPRPLWEWSAGDPQSPSPVLGRRGTAPDGRPCLVAMRAQNSVVAVQFTASPAGLFPYDPETEVVCDVWVGSTVRWAGFYVQDDASTRRIEGRRADAHMGEWHVPLAARDGWIRVRFPLGATADDTRHPPLQRGDRIHHFMVQAQPAGSSILCIDRLEIVPTAR